MLSTTDLATVLDTASGFFRSQALFAGVELGLFTVLAERPATAEEISDRLGLHPAAARDFLDALVALSLLRLDGERYANTPASATYLDKERGAYVGGFLMFMKHALYPAWGRLPQLLRTGQVQEGDDSFAEFYRDPDRVRGFMAAMDGASAIVAEQLATTFDWSGYSTFADLGGARGNLAATIVKANPQLSGVCFDVPPLQPFFEEHMHQLGTADAVAFRAGDFLTDPLPEADVLIFGHVLHDWDETHRALLIRRAYEAIKPGGALLIYDEMIDDDRRGPAHNLLMSLNMKLVRSGASEYSAEDARSWLSDAGFTDSSVRSLTSTERLLVAHKK
ncbi:methyltransferase [Paractinoplanes toevensis]|uniref:O-methyltransferase n=1 Tax=Paractinoplanes toevensis TaxID=571911 RepID=A0A919TBZ2_9ACTN|nr:methyltransferase [Actinoplanes toevensis]GIM92623.1 O-methyltransferase [Actinoplanes toevensis]